MINQNPSENIAGGSASSFGENPNGDMVAVNTSLNIPGEQQEVTVSLLGQNPNGERFSYQNMHPAANSAADKNFSFQSPDATVENRTLGRAVNGGSFGDEGFSK